MSTWLFISEITLQRRTKFLFLFDIKKEQLTYHMKNIKTHMYGCISRGKHTYETSALLDDIIPVFS